MRITLFSPIETGFLCYMRSAMDGGEFSPEVLLLVQLIEGYVQFLRVGCVSCEIDLQQCSLCNLNPLPCMLGEGYLNGSHGGLGSISTEKNSRPICRLIAVTEKRVQSCVGG